jgi:uncharacterized membrane protein (DUF2068 family)
MNYLKYTQYVYLLAAIIFIYNGISEISTKTGTPYLSFFLAAMAIFMFFFRRKFAKKFDNQDKKE